jgi:hypothetical protein
VTLPGPCAAVSTSSARGLELDNPGFHHSVLGGFRDRPGGDDWGRRYGRPVRQGESPVDVPRRHSGARATPTSDIDRTVGTRSTG